jgi:hypothetical protein
VNPYADVSDLHSGPVTTRAGGFYVADCQLGRAAVRVESAEPVAAVVDAPASP